MKLAVVVLNYNDAETTGAFLQHIQDYSLVEKIIVVDNASTDDSFEQLQVFKNEKTDLIRTKENGGYGKGNNYGIQYAMKAYQPEYLVVSNPDIIFEESLLQEMLEFVAASQEKIGMVTATMLNPDGTKARNTWKMRTARTCISENLFLLNRFRKGTQYPQEHFSGSNSEVDIISGAFFMIHSETMKNIGMFDERTFLYWEEDILGYKLKEQNYKSFILNQSSFIHNHSVSISKNIQSLEKKLDLAEDSKRLYMKEYLKVGKVLTLLEKCSYFIGKKSYLLVKRKR